MSKITYHMERKFRPKRGKVELWESEIDSVETEEEAVRAAIEATDLLNEHPPPGQEGAQYVLKKVFKKRQLYPHV